MKWEITEDGRKVLDSMPIVHVSAIAWALGVRLEADRRGYVRVTRREGEAK